MPINIHPLGSSEPLLRVRSELLVYADFAKQLPADVDCHRERIIFLDRRSLAPSW